MPFDQVLQAKIEDFKEFISGYLFWYRFQECLARDLIEKGIFVCNENGDLMHGPNGFFGKQA